MVVLTEVRWASRVWALPFLSALAPSERYARFGRPKAQEPHRMGLAASSVGEALVPRTRDSSRSRQHLRFLEAPRPMSGLSNPITFISRLRLDAALYEPAPPRYPGQLGRPRLKGDRLANLSVVAENPEAEWEPITITGWYGGQQRTVEVISATAVWYSTSLPAVPLRWVLIRDPNGEFETQALLCTKLDADPERIISYFVRRWQLEATFQEVRQRLGFETQRHWSEKAIRRTAPALLGLFSVVTLLANHQMANNENMDAVRRAAWYDKSRPTFSDALALVRKELWAQEQTFYGSPAQTDMVKVPRVFMERLTDAVCYAA